MEKKKVYIRNKFIFFVLVVYLICVIIVVKDVVNCLYWEYAKDNSFKWNYFKELLIPFLILIIFSLIPLNKYIRIILNCMFFLFLLISPFYVYMLSPIFLYTLRPDENQYSEVLQKYVEKKVMNPQYIKHFPIELPKFYNNCWAMIDDNRSFIYLIFNSTDEYIEEIIKKYKEEILLKTTTEKIDYNTKLFSFNCNSWNENSYDVYILKTSNIEANKLSGFAIDRAKKEIMFFYSDSGFKSYDWENRSFRKFLEEEAKKYESTR